MMQGSYISFLDNAIFHSRANMAARELGHIIENEAI